MTFEEWLDQAQRVIRRGGTSIELSQSEYEELCRLVPQRVTMLCGLDIVRRPPYDWAKESS